MVKQVPAASGTVSCLSPCRRHISPRPCRMYQISSTQWCATGRETRPAPSSKCAMLPPASRSSTRTQEPSGAMASHPRQAAAQCRNCGPPATSATARRSATATRDCVVGYASPSRCTITPRVGKAGHSSGQGRADRQSWRAGRVVTPRGREHIRDRGLAGRRARADHGHVPPALVGGRGTVTIRKSCGPVGVCPGRRGPVRPQPHDFRIRTRHRRKAFSCDQVRGLSETRPSGPPRISIELLLMLQLWRGAPKRQRLPKSI